MEHFKGGNSRKKGKFYLITNLNRIVKNKINFMTAKIKIVF